MERTVIKTESIMLHPDVWTPQLLFDGARQLSLACTSVMIDDLSVIEARFPPIPATCTYSTGVLLFRASKPRMYCVKL